MNIVSILYKKTKQSGLRYGKYVYLGCIKQWRKPSGGIAYLRAYACDVCSKDVEMYPHGIIANHITVKGLESGKDFCMCGPKKNFNAYRYNLFYKRLINSFDLVFVSTDYESKRVTYFCDVCLNSSTVLDSSFIRKPGCCVCNEKMMRLNRRLSLKDLESRFYDSGYWSSDYKVRLCTSLMERGIYYYCDVYCPQCNEWSTGRIYDYVKGISSCKCSNPNQKYLYINAIYNNDSLVCYKYGIAINPDDRLYSQDRHSIYSVKPYLLYKFDSSLQCRRAESLLKALKLKPFLSVENFSDGFSETFSIDFIDLVLTTISIYQSYLEN